MLIRVWVVSYLPKSFIDYTEVHIMLTYVLSVPLEQADNYTAHGWEYVSMDKDHAGYVLVCKYLEASSPEESGKTIHLERLKRPNMLQRATIRRPFSRWNDARFFDSVTLEHPYSEKFAMAVPASLRRMSHTRFAYDIFKAENLFVQKDNRSYALRILTRMRGVELEQYVNWLIAIRSGDMKVLAPSGFTKQDFSVSQLPTAPDLWWDVENDVVFSFDKNYMSRLQHHLDVSYSIIDGNYASGSISRAS